MDKNETPSFWKIQNSRSVFSIFHNEGVSFTSILQTCRLEQWSLWARAGGVYRVCLLSCSWEHISVVQSSVACLPMCFLALAASLVQVPLSILSALRVFILLNSGTQWRCLFPNLKPLRFLALCYVIYFHYTYQLK